MLKKQDKISVSSRYSFASSDGLTVELLGEGGFARVYLGSDLHTGAEVAFKIPTIRPGDDPTTIDSVEKFFDQEIEKLQSLSGVRNVLQYRDDSYFAFSDLVFIIPGNEKVHRFVHVTPPAAVAVSAAEVMRLLLALRQQPPTASIDDLYQERKKLRGLICRETDFLRNVGVRAADSVLLNGLRFLVTDRYQYTLQYIARSLPGVRTDSVLSLLEHPLGALVQLHLAGIRHGDIAPDNIMFDAEGSRFRETIAEEVVRRPELQKIIEDEPQAFYNWRAILIDLGLVLHNPRQQHKSASMPTLFHLRRDKMLYASHEARTSTSDLATTIDCYRFDIPKDRAGKLRLTRVLRKQDERSPEMFGLSRMSEDASVSDLSTLLRESLQPGDVVYNSTHAFVVLNVAASYIELDPDRIYRTDASSALRPLQFEEFQEDAQRNGVDIVLRDPLQARRGYGIPADLFSFAMCIVFVVCSRARVPTTHLSKFVDRMRSEGVQVGRTVDDWYETKEEAVAAVRELFVSSGLPELYRFVLRCCLRGAKDQGYYCASYAEDEVLCSVRALRDFVALRRTQISYDMLGKELSEVQTSYKRMKDEADALAAKIETQSRVISANAKELSQLREQRAALQIQVTTISTERAAVERQLEDKKQVCLQTEENIQKLEQKSAAEIESRKSAEKEIVVLRAEISDLTRKLSNAEKQLNLKSGELETASKTHIQMTQQVESLTAQRISVAQTFDNRVRHLTSQLELESQVRSSVSAELQALQAKMAEDLKFRVQTEDDNKELRSRMEQEAKEKNKLLVQISELQQRLAVASSLAGDMLRELTDAKKASGEIRQQLDMELAVRLRVQEQFANIESLLVEKKLAVVQCVRMSREAFLAVNTNWWKRDNTKAIKLIQQVSERLEELTEDDERGNS